MNLFDDDWTDEEEREGYRGRERRLGPTLGAEKIGGTVYGGFLRTDGARVRMLNRESANIDYFDGER